MNWRKLIVGLVLSAGLSGCGLAHQAPRDHSKPVAGADAGDRRGVGQCGIERWAVKTGTDAESGQVNLTPQPSTVAQLTALPAPPQPTTRVSGVETTTYQIDATVVAIKEEADSDYHLALSDGQGHTMIAESPDPACATGSPWLPQIQAVRMALNTACPNVGPSYLNTQIPATLTGVGFFDRIHGQRAVAPNGIELHPLLAIQLRGSC